MARLWSDLGLSLSLVLCQMSLYVWCLSPGHTLSLPYGSPLLLFVSLRPPLDIAHTERKNTREEGKDEEKNNFTREKREEYQLFLM